MFKKLVFVVLTLVITVSALGCANGNSTSKQPVDTQAAEETDKTKISEDNTIPQEQQVNTTAPADSKSSNDITQTPADTSANTNSKTPPGKTHSTPTDTKSQTASSKPPAATGAGSQAANPKPPAAATKPPVTTPGKQAPKDPIMALGKLEFTLNDIEGDKYKSSDIFGANKLTMINIWGTLCTPCIKELPELQELSGELANKGIGIIGLVGDVSGDESLEDASAIVKKKKVDFINLVPDDAIRESLLSKIKGYPVTIFVDSNGNLVGEVIVGARSKDEYKKAAEKILDTLS